jgi:hypothetical protein
MKRNKGKFLLPLIIMSVLIMAMQLPQKTDSKIPFDAEFEKSSEGLVVEAAKERMEPLQILYFNLGDYFSPSIISEQPSLMQGDCRNHYSYIETTHTDISIQLPFTANTTWKVGGFEDSSPYYYGECTHNSGVDSYYATDWQRMDGLTYGEEVYPVAQGYVIWANEKPGGWDKTVVIVHKGLSGNYEYESWYSHLSSINVGYGDWVDFTTVIGNVGTGGTGPHLHLEWKHSSSCTDEWFPDCPRHSIGGDADSREFTPVYSYTSNGGNGDHPLCNGCEYTARRLDSNVPTPTPAPTPLPPDPNKPIIHITMDEPLSVSVDSQYNGGILPDGTVATDVGCNKGQSRLFQQAGSTIERLYTDKYAPTNYYFQQGKTTSDSFTVDFWFKYNGGGDNNKQYLVNYLGWIGEARKGWQIYYSPNPGELGFEIFSPVSGYLLARVFLNEPTSEWVHVKAIKDHDRFGVCAAVNGGNWICGISSIKEPLDYYSETNLEIGTGYPINSSNEPGKSWHGFIDEFIMTISDGLDAVAGPDTSLKPHCEPTSTTTPIPTITPTPTPTMTPTPTPFCNPEGDMCGDYFLS